jgi:hypothetical protein
VLGAIHRFVRLPEELFCVRVGGRFHSDADTGADRDFLSLVSEGLRTGADQPLRDVRRLVLVVQVLADERELVTSEPRGGVAVAEPLDEPLAQLDEQRVPSCR